MKNSQHNSNNLTNDFTNKPSGIFTSAAVKSFEEKLVSETDFLEKTGNK